jgi:hypothetical protein|uniref:Uncharacterized protein n=1 Tax=Populus trichocarpa TaxID=3694 RepID=A9PHP6_POPTR|nr:unknown [Populus trichocarpa]
MFSLILAALQWRFIKHSRALTSSEMSYRATSKVVSLLLKATPVRQACLAFVLQRQVLAPQIL